MANPSESQISKEESVKRFTTLGVPEKVWELIGNGLNLSIREQRELYHRACRVAASQVVDLDQARKIRGHGLNVLYGLIKLPKSLRKNE